jgi:hypothetical protein
MLPNLLKSKKVTENIEKTYGRFNGILTPASLSKA